MRRHHYVMIVTFAIAVLASGCSGGGSSGDDAFTRDDAIVSVMDGNSASPAQAECIVDGFTEDFELETLKFDREPTSEEQSLLFDLILDCLARFE